MLKLSGLANNVFRIAKNNIHLFILLGIIYFAIWLRLPTASTDILLDYDPWWFFRHAQEILSNGFLPLKWDELSYFPPWRPVDYQVGWPYTIAISYVVTKVFLPAISLMKFSTYFMAIFAGICAIPAYLVGRMVTNKWGGLATAFFATVTPTFLSVSMAGYPDSDGIVVFYTFLSVLATLYAVKNFKGVRNPRSWIFIGLAVLTYWLFAFNWNTSWYIYVIFILSIPFLVIALALEEFVHKKEIKNPIKPMYHKIKELRSFILPIIMIGIVGFLLTYLTSGWPFNTLPPDKQIIGGLDILKANTILLVFFVAFVSALGGIAGIAAKNIKFGIIGGIIGLIFSVYLAINITGQPLIVNISVAELQTINVFSKEGFLSAVSRIGITQENMLNPLAWTNPVIWGVLGMIGIAAYKIYYKKKISLAEYFAFIWMIISFWLINSGIRFSLIFSLAIATSVGFVVGNLIEIIKEKKRILLTTTVIGLLLFSVLVHASYNIQISLNTGGMEVDQNWRDALDWLKNNADKNALVATWWDPGHIIAGYSGLRVHADGAHCGPDSCVPYNHNIRIQDMGKIFAASDENESVSILKKYQQLTPEQCQKVKQEFGNIVPEDACDKIPEIYLIASSDLIGKYYWLSFFGTKEGVNYYQLTFSGFDQSNLPTYGGILTLLQNTDGSIMAVMNIPDQGIRNAVVRQIVYFDQNGEKRYDYSNTTNTMDGMAWVDSSFSVVFFMPPEVRDSVFTRLFFFNGEGLSKFNLVFINSEVKIYKVAL